MGVKIEQVESQFAQKLDEPLKQLLHEFSYAVPSRSQVRISLLDAKRRKKRSNASAENWSPESGRIEISFEPTASEDRTPESERTGSPALIPSGSVEPQNTGCGPEHPQFVHPAEADLLRILVKALDRAEGRPGWNFVPLKKFRDEILPSENLPSMPSDVERQSVLRSAIEKRLILVGKVPNPKAPQFPVTTIRLNRLMPEVEEILGRDANADLEFRPVEIRGEPLSSTILRERR
jgi:hypothetical protein